MLQVLPTHASLLKSQLKLPEQSRQSAIVLEFSRPVNRALLSDFLRIHLTPMMMSGGEDDHYLPQIVQPERMGPRHCPQCRKPMHRTGLNTWQCAQRDCTQPDGTPSHQVEQVGGPVCGVVRLVHFDEFEHSVEYLPTRLVTLAGDPVNRRIVLVTGVVLQLDRRYRDEVLAAIKRTAKLICEDRGWELV